VRALWLAALAALGCTAALPDPVEPLARTPDAAFRKHPPERRAGAPTRLPAVRTERLPNGLLVVAATRANSPTATVELVVRGAGVDRGAAGRGLALGTAFALIEAPETIFSVDVEHDAAHFGIHTVEAGIDSAVKEIASALVRPHVDDEVVFTTQRWLAARIQRERGKNLVYSVAYRRLYAEPPPLLDPREVTAYGMGKGAILEQYRRFYGPENSALIVASSAPFERVLALATEHFGGWKAGGRPAPRAPTGLPLLVPSVGPRPIIAVDSDDELASAVLIVPGPPRGFPGFAEYLLADTLLGSSISSRGYAALRLHSGKSYGVWSSLERRRMGSELEVFFAVEQDDIVESLQRIVAEIERLRREPVSREELDVAKIAWRARLASRLVTSAGTVSLLGEAFALDGDPAALSALIESVESVTPEGIQDVARREFTPDRIQVVVAADRQKLEAALRHVGSIWWEDFGSEG
jgi:zinc protease